MSRLLFIGIVILFFFASEVRAAAPAGQIIRGIVVDKQLQKPLAGATVWLLDSDPLKVTVTDSAGIFRLIGVPLGRQSIEVRFVGYFPFIAGNMIVNSARETVLFIELVEKVETTGEVIVRGNARSRGAINQMATVSARTFTVEEAARYAGTREDVARMAMNFAGVSGANDSRNDIIVRGNTPGGVLWRLEDVDIPNPNHFAASGTTGGPVGMLNNNTLRNSDFYTGAFPAEYTNAFSAVFDLNMREGNNENYDFLGQMGFNGFELGAEGPLRLTEGSSFMLNYRYSTLQIFDMMGISFGTAGIPNYRDLSGKISFPMKRGKLTLFTLAGNSHIEMFDSKENSADLFTGEGMDLVNGSSLTVSGMNYLRFHGDNIYSKLVLSYINQNGLTRLDKFDPGEAPSPYYREDNYEERFSLNYIFNMKMNRKLSLRSGAVIDRYGYKLQAKVWAEDNSGWENMLNNRKGLISGNNLFRSYAQVLYKFSDVLEVNPGLSFMFFDLNRTVAIEPRLGVRWKTGVNSSLNFGYGKHSRLQSMATYFLETIYPDGTFKLDNLNLDFTRAHHAALGFDVLLSERLRMKAETYYQYLYDVPVESEPSWYSMVNAGAEWGLNTRYSMVNSGKAWNYGIEFTLEKFYHKNFYFLITYSLYDSKYTGSDGVKRNSAFNGNFVANGLVGKEFPLNENATLVFDTRITWAGGKRYTPIDEEASKNTADVFDTEYYWDQAYSLQFPNYLKADVKVGFRKDGRKISQLWEFYIENVTNHKNPLNQSYSKTKGRIETVYQLGFFPVFNYRIYF